MRDATKEEQESVNRYVESISKPTGINFYDLLEGDTNDTICLINHLPCCDCSPCCEHRELG